MRPANCTCVMPTRWGDPAEWQGACEACEQQMEDEERQDTFERIYKNVDCETGTSNPPPYGALTGRG